MNAQELAARRTHYRSPVREMPEQEVPTRGRVVQLTHALLTIGGIETCIRELSSRLSGEGVTTEILVSNPLQRPPTSAGGSPVIDVPFDDTDAVITRVHDFHPDLVVLHSVAKPAISDALRVRYRTVEVVHTLLCPGSKLFRRGDEPCGHPVGLRCLVDWYWGPCGPSRNPISALRGVQSAREHIAALCRLDQVLVGSRYMREYLVGEGIPAERISVVRLPHGGPSTNRAHHGERSPEIYRLLFVGRVTYNKGLQYLLSALALLETSFHLDVAGDGWFLPRAMELSHGLGLVDRTRFLGSVAADAVPALYQYTDLVVVPSICPEPVGLVVGEARSHGVPVVVTEAGGLPEWADDDPSVLVAPRADARALAATIEDARRQQRTSRPRDARDHSLTDAIIGALHAAKPRSFSS